MPSASFRLFRRAALAGGVLGLPLLAQSQNPVPAAAPAAPIVLRGATLHLGDGRTVIEGGAVAFAAGKLTYVGPASGLPAAAGATVVDVSGQHVYPGLILANSTLGLTEIDAVRATVDEREVGTFNPNVRALVAYNTDSDILPTIRTNGVLTVQVTPRGGTISGQSSIVQLDAWTWEDAAVRPDDGLHVNWPRYLPRTGLVPDSIVQKRQKGRDLALHELQLLFTDAKAYHAAPAGAPLNRRLAALDAVLAGRQTLFLHADGTKEIVEAIRWAQELKIGKIVLVGGAEAAQVREFLAEAKVPVVLGRIHALPPRPDDDVDGPFRLPKQLFDAGIPFCFSYEGDMENAGARNLAFTAGTAVAYGLPAERALHAMTGGAAAILGLPQQGTLAAGQDATLIVSRGDLLDMRTNALTSAYIQGRPLDLRNKQQALSEKYRQKYGLK